MDLKKVLKEKFGFDNFREHQEDIVRALIEDKKDVCVIMFTGAGKSLCYQFPAVFMNKTALVISPLISLMNDQQEKLDALNIPSVCVNGTLNRFSKEKVVENIINGKYRIVYTTPEYIVKNDTFLSSIKDHMALVAIDEAHCISSWGHDFRDSYRQLHKIREWVPGVPLIALTATATDRVQKDIISSLKLKKHLLVKTTFDRPNLYIKIKYKSNNPKNDLLPLIKKGDCLTIVYCQTRKETDHLSKILLSGGVRCHSYHAGMNEFEREIVQEAFADNSIDCVVATVAFGMGIDKEVRTVIHYGRPRDMESYYQEIGRAGRDGKPSYCYLFYTLTDNGINNYFIMNIHNIKYRDHKIELASIINKYIYTEDCRKKHIIEYFGEKFDKQCKNCDNCLEDIELKRFDLASWASMLIKAIYYSEGVYGVTMIINILRGSQNKKMSSDSKKLSVFGCGNNRSIDWWKIFIRLIINMDLIREYVLSQRSQGMSIKVTEEGKKWLIEYGRQKKANKPCKLMIIIPREMEQLNEDRVIGIKTSNTSRSFDTNSTDSKSVSNNSSIKLTKKCNKTDEIYDLFQNQKLSVSDISKKMKYSKMVIEHHLTKCYKDGKNLNLDRLGFNEEVYLKIYPVIKKALKDSKLKDIKNELGDKYTYHHIKLSQVKMENNPEPIKKSNMETNMDNFEIDAMSIGNITKDDETLKKSLKNTEKKYKDIQFI